LHLKYGSHGSPVLFFMLIEESRMTPEIALCRLRAQIDGAGLTPAA